MTATERDYLARNHPELLRPENERAAREHLRNHAGAIADWLRYSRPETADERFYRERAEREQKGGMGW